MTEHHSRQPWPGPTMVALVDGRLVFSDAEEWRHETEAREYLRMPYEARQEHMRKLAEKRPNDAARLLETMAQIRGARA